MQKVEVKGTGTYISLTCLRPFAMVQREIRKSHSYEIARQIP